MKEVLYAAEEDFLERYLKEKASASLGDFKAASDLWGKPIPDPGTDGAVDEIYSLEGSAAHIKIEGPLSIEGPDFWDRFWGYNGASYKTIQAAMERAKNDPLARSVIFDVDSPGGTVAGCDETWQAHKDLAARKPTEAHAVNMLASAAYEIMTPAGKILATTPSTRIGSIGVLVATYDFSKWEDDHGIKQVVITSSNAPDKHPDISTQKGRDTIKAQLDALERIFYDRISESRGVTAEHIAEHFGRGGMLVAKDPSPEHEDAVRAGMIDGLTADSPSVSHNGEDDENARQLNDANTFHNFVNDKLGSAIFDFLAENPCTGNISICWGDREHFFVGMNKEEADRFAKRKQSPLGEKNTPATAGKTQEGQNMDLSELLKANPAAAAEFDKLRAEAKAEGRKEAQVEQTARIERVLPIIQSDAYPAHIKTVACNVLAGKDEMAAFTASVTTYDSLKEAGKSADAKTQTGELGSVTAEAPNGKSPAEQELDAALQADLDKRKEKK